MEEDESPFSRVPRPGSSHEDPTPLTFEGQMNGLRRFSTGLGSGLHPVVRITIGLIGLAFVFFMFIWPSFS